jgi:lipopolysaccharide export system permease protein
MIVFQVISIAMKNLAAKNPDLVPLMYLNALLPIAGGLYWTFRGPQIRAKAGSRDEVPA